jgi:hypothetical protein
MKKTEQAKETKRQRAERIAGSSNGMTLRTRVVPSKKKYDRREAKRIAFREL